MLTATSQKLSALFCLPESVAVIIPSTRDVNQAADIGILDTVRANVQAALSRLAGGCTATHGRGGWLADNGEYIEEDVTILEAYTADAQAIADNVIDLAQYVKDALTQESVAIRVNGKLYLV